MLLNAETKLCVLIGNPVEHSKSPIIQNKAFAELRLNWVYLATNVTAESLPEAIGGLKGLSIKGANVTIPYKEQVLQYLDEIDSEAQLIGAVNTIVNKNGKLIGHNTDGRGFIYSIKEEGFDPKGKKAVILGAGGSAKAVAVTLAGNGLQDITFFNRNLKKACLLGELISNNFHCKCSVHSLSEQDALAAELSEADILINTTPHGMYPHHKTLSIVPKEYLNSKLFVVDLIYNPVKTSLLLEAEKVGCKSISGMGMLLYQGILACEIWTGHWPPEVGIRKVLEQSLKSDG